MKALLQLLGLIVIAPAFIVGFVLGLVGWTVYAGWLAAAKTIGWLGGQL